MLELAAILATHSAFAWVHAAHRGELPLSTRRLGNTGRRVLRLVALLTAILAFAAGSQQLGALIASLVCGVALCLSGTLVVTLRPVAPRVLWGSAYASTAAAGLLAAGAAL